MVFSIIPGLLLGSVLSLLLNSVVCFEHGVVSDLFFSLVEDFVLVGVSNLNLLFVGSLTVWSGQVVNLGPPSVLFLLSVENVVDGLIGYDWDISVVGLGVGVIDGPWHFFVLGEMIDSVEGLVLSGVPLLILGSVLSLRLSMGVRNFNLSCPDFDLNLVCNLVFGLVIGHWDINNLINLNVVNVGMNVVMIVVASVKKWFPDGAYWFRGNVWLGSVCWCWCRVAIIERWEGWS